MSAEIGKAVISLQIDREKFASWEQPTFLLLSGGQPLGHVTTIPNEMDFVDAFISAVEDLEEDILQEIGERLLIDDLQGVGLSVGFDFPAV